MIIYFLYLKNHHLPIVHFVIYRIFFNSLSTKPQFCYQNKLDEHKNDSTREQVNILQFKRENIVCVLVGLLLGTWSLCDTSQLIYVFLIQPYHF